MIENELLAAQNLNIDFHYPKEYLEFIQNSEIISDTPWWLIGNTNGAFNVSYETINSIYKSTKLLIPFAKSDQSNILACFDKEHRVWLTSCENNDITNANWNTRFYYENFRSWLDDVLQGEVF